MTKREQLQAEIIEKQKELIEHLTGYVYDSYDNQNVIEYLSDRQCPLCRKLASEFSALEKEGEEISSSSAKNYDPEDE